MRKRSHDEGHDRERRPPGNSAAETGAALVPAGEQACVWMQAGLIAWWLCDLDYHCERCPLDAALRHAGDALEEVAGARPPATEASAAEPAGAVPLDVVPPDTVPRRPAPPPAAPGVPADMEALLRRRLPPLHMECIYHPAHTWVRRETPTRARIGLDAFVARIAGRPRGVVLPPPGTPIRQGHPCAWLDTPGGTLTVLAPISGLVVEANGVLTGSPEQTGAEPFAGGWLLLLLPSDWEREAQRLAPAEDFHRTVARDLVAWRSVVLQAIRARSPAVGPTFADGGTRVTDLDQLIGPRRRWEFALPYFAGHPRQPPRRSRRGS